MDEFDLAAIADGDDAPGHAQVLAPVDRAGLDHGFDLIETCLDGLAFVDKIVGPVIVVHVGEFVVAAMEAFDLGLLFVRRFGRLRAHPPEAGDAGPVHIDARLGPFPARRKLIRRRLQLVHGKRVQQFGIVKPDALLVLFGEQVAVDRAARRFVGFNADETGNGGCAGDPVFGQHAPDLPGAGPVALVLNLFPHCRLARLVCGNGESHQCFQIDFSCTVGLEQHRCCVAQPQAFLHGALGNPEARRNGGRRAAGIGQAAERLDLIGRMHGGADRVLGQGDFFLCCGIIHHAARHGVIPVQCTIGGQRLHRGKPPSAGDHGVTSGRSLLRT